MNGRLWEHQAIRDHHTMTMTRAYPVAGPHSVATCRCGWTNTVALAERDNSGTYLAQDSAIVAHWRSAIDGAVA